MPGLRVCLLGAPCVELDGEPVHLGRRKNVALIAYLAVTGESHSREALITLLWPELEPSRARANLRRNLSTLRKALGEELLVADWETVGLEPSASLSVDVDQFRSLVRGWHRHGHAEGDVCPECLSSLAEAVEIYRGDFLAGFGLADSAAFDDWQFFQTEGLRQELASALERLVRGHSARGAYDAAIGYARRWLALDPLHEPVHRQLMRLYDADGQRAAALRQYGECKRVLEEELGLLPSEETTSLYEEIRGGPAERAEPVVAPPAPRPRHNLPIQPTPFIGREAMLVEIKGRLQDPGCRLLTLVGPGGSGKTRLALEAAAARLDDFEDGAFFVSLAPLRSVESFEATVAAVLGFSLSGGGDPRQQLLAYLKTRHLLLILDNFEHLLHSSLPLAGGDRGGESLVTGILETAPEVKILATSRVGLKVRGEHLYAVTGMGSPRVPSTPAVTLAEVDQYDAVQLFIAGARRAQSAFELTDDNLTGVVRTCHLVGGMPLGILIAAAWVGILTPAEIGDEISQSLDFLEADQSDVPERQRSMRAVFDHSWGLLTERQREVFQALSVFRGGFTRQAAQHVAGATLRELKGLTDRSLVHVAPTRRYELHELLRQYGVQRLEQSPEVSEGARDRHCAYYVGALERWGEELKGPRQRAALAELEVEIENARAAWRRAVERGQVDHLDRAMEGLFRFYEWRARWQEGLADSAAAAERLEGLMADSRATASAVEKPALTADAPPAAAGYVPSADAASVAEGTRVLARVLMWQARSSRGVGRNAAARQLASRSLALLERPELAGQDVRRERASLLAQAAYNLHEASVFTDDEECRQAAAQSAALYEELGDAWSTAYALRLEGLLCWRLNQYDEGQRLLERCLALFEALGDQRYIAAATTDLGVVALTQGQPGEGEQLLRRGIALLEKTEESYLLWVARRRLAIDLYLSGEFTRARPLAQDCCGAPDDATGELLWPALSYALLALIDMHLGQWDKAAVSAEMSSKLAAEVGYRSVGYTLWALSCLALAEMEGALDASDQASMPEIGEMSEAQTDVRQLAYESATAPWEGYRRSHHASAVAVRGAVERRLGDPGQSQQCLCEALAVAAKSGDLGLTMHTLPLAALLLADQGETERALELYALASRYPFVANSRWFEDVFGRQIEAIAASLPPEVVAAARERGRARDLDATVAELLTELGADLELVA